MERARKSSERGRENERAVARVSESAETPRNWRDSRGERDRGSGRGSRRQRKQPRLHSALHARAVERLAAARRAHERGAVAVGGAPADAVGAYVLEADDAACAAAAAALLGRRRARADSPTNDGRRERRERRGRRAAAVGARVGAAGALRDALTRCAVSAPVGDAARGASRRCRPPPRSRRRSSARARDAGARATLTIAAVGPREPAAAALATATKRARRAA